ncbi:MAG TPA: hypothetical protein VK501_01620 [Baekduia sp.]|uniref:hypothetical protein n=1 Tax=Baekduia sp. TaxID=2600305 RepID=UPI002C029283|nr:hypothetical protein [Baekduia sp.]HMJ32587.1 hypothetical protein [Baekduia sp.]
MLSLAWVPAASAAQTSNGRGYELVNGPDINVSEIPRVPTATDDGGAVAFLTFATSDEVSGAVVASTEVARRTTGGWQRTDGTIPVVRGPQTLGINWPAAFSRDLSREVQHSGGPSDPDDLDGDFDDLYAFDVGSQAYRWLSKPDVLPDRAPTAATFVGASHDLQRVTFEVHFGPILSGAPNDALYVNDATGTRLVSVLPDGTPAANPTSAAYPWQRGLNDNVFLGTRVAHGGRHSVSDDGRRAFFYDSQSFPAPIYLRDDDHTVPISASQRTGDVGTMHAASFIAASHDGSVALFESPDQLTDAAPAGGGIYRYDIDAGSLTLLVAANDPGGLQLGSAIASDDLSHLYFVSPVAFTADAQAGQPNVYVFSGGTPTFVATVGFGETVARVSRTGRYAVLRTTSSLGGAPNNGHTALYAYDAETGSLVCASCRPDGVGSEGDANLDDQLPGLLQPAFTATRNITDDGVLFFASKDRIVRDDLGPAADIYEFDHGTTTLLTSGRSDADAFMADNGDDGRDVFFTTRDRLTSSDGDGGLLDLYDARRGGGFPEPPSSKPGCTDDGCQGPVPARPVLPGIRSSSPSGQGNAERPVVPPKMTIKLTALTARSRAQLARTGRATLAVRVSGGGKVSVSVRGAVGGRTVTLASASRTVRTTKATTVHLRLTLTRSAKTALARHRRLKVTIEARLAGVANVQKSTLTLVAAQR